MVQHVTLQPNTRLKLTAPGVYGRIPFVIIPAWRHSLGHNPLGSAHRSPGISGFRRTLSLRRASDETRHLCQLPLEVPGGVPLLRAAPWRQDQHDDDARATAES